MAPLIGVLTLQGDFARHLAHLQSCGARTRTVRSRDDLTAIDGLVIPGGESTTIGKLMDRYGLLSEIRDLAAGDLPVYGTCAGAILLAKEIVGSDQHRLGIMDIAVSRNAYGRQIESFEVDLMASELGPKPIRGVFIRAPIVESVGEGVNVLSRFEEKPVLLRQGPLLAGTFHPELTNDTRVHAFFLEMI